MTVKDGLTPEERATLDDRLTKLRANLAREGLRALDGGEYAPDHEAAKEIITQARRSQCIADCEAVCPRCISGDPLVLGKHGGYFHENENWSAALLMPRWAVCVSSAIRTANAALLASGDKKGEA